MNKKEQFAVQPTVKLLWHSPEPRKTIARAAQVCYSALPLSSLDESLTEEKITRLVGHILAVRHYSVLRHVIFAFTIEGVSRSFLAQFSRHHVGVDIEVRSQHFRREKMFAYNLPNSVVDAGTGEDSKDAEEIYIRHMEQSQGVYDDLIALGVDKSEARQVLPNACESQMVCTMNLNSAMNIISQRACRLNTPEILNVAVQMRKIIGGVMPEALAFLGPTCWSQGVCYEGEKYFKACLRPWQSPTVLWDNQFPQRVRLVGIKDGKHVERTMNMSLAEQTEIPVPRHEPALDQQLAQGEDGKNGS